VSAVPLIELRRGLLVASTTTVLASFSTVLSAVELVDCLTGRAFPTPQKLTARVSRD